MRDDARKANSESGFALYLAVGFVVLMSFLVGTVGDRINVTTINQARAFNNVKLRSDAETALSRGWKSVRMSTLPGTPGDRNVNADIERCLADKEDMPNAFRASQRFINEGRISRFFFRRDLSVFTIYGCSWLNNDKQRVKAAYYYSDNGEFSLMQLRRY